MSPFLPAQLLGALWFLYDGNRVSKDRFETNLAKLEGSIYKASLQKTISAYKAELEKNNKKEA